MGGPGIRDLQKGPTLPGGGAPTKAKAGYWKLWSRWAVKLNLWRWKVGQYKWKPYLWLCRAAPTVLKTFVLVLNAASSSTVKSRFFLSYPPILDKSRSESVNHKWISFAQRIEGWEGQRLGGEGEEEEMAKGRRRRKASIKNCRKQRSSIARAK